MPGSSNSKQFFSQSAALLCMISRDGQFSEANPAWKARLGYSFGVLSNGLFWELMHPDDEEAVAAHFDVPLYSSQAFQFSSRCRHSNGAYHAIQWQVTPIPSEEAFYIIGLLQEDAPGNVTGAQPPSRLQDFSTTLIQTSPVFFVALSPEGKIIQLNETMLKALDYSLDDLVGKNYLDILVPEEEQTPFADALGDLAAGIEEKKLLEGSVRGRDGEQRLVEWHFHASHEVEGWDNYLFGVGIDIDDRQRTREQLQLFQTMVENSHEAISICDLKEGVLRYSNPAHAELFHQGYMPPENYDYRQYFSGDNADLFEHTILPALLMNESWEGYLSFDNGDEYQQTLWARFDALPHSDEQPAYIVALMHDVTEQQEMEQAMRYEHAQYETIFNAAPLMIIYKDLQSRVIRANNFAQLLLGNQDENQAAAPVIDEQKEALSVDYTQQYYADDQEVIRSGKPKLGIIEKTKGYFFETDKVPYRDADDNIQGVIVFASDITQYIEAERALNREREQYETIFNAAPLMIIYKDEYSRIIRINQYAADFFGHSINELEGSQKDAEHIEYKNKYYADDREVMRKGKPKLGIIEKTKGRYFRTDKIPYRDNQGKIIGVVVFAQDITERVQAENALQENEQRLRLLVEKMPLLLKAYDEQGHLVMWNRYAEQVTGYSAKEMIRNPDALRLLYPQPEYRAYREKLVRRGGLNHWETEITCKDGSRRRIRWQNNSEQMAIPGWACWMIGEDLSDSPEARNNFREDNHLLADFLDTLSAAACVTDSNGRLVYINSSFCALSGYPELDLQQRHFTVLLPKQRHSEWLRRYFSLLGEERNLYRNEQETLQNAAGASLSVKFEVHCVHGKQGGNYVVWRAQSG